MAKTNYSFNKRQKELARKKKKDQKKQRKLDKNLIKSEDNPVQPDQTSNMIEDFQKACLYKA